MSDRPEYFEDTDIYRRHMADGKMPYPEVIQFEVTSDCNLRCVMCPITTRHRERKADETRFSLDQVRRLDELWEHATEIELTGFGEIFTHPDIVPILRHLRSKKLSLYGSTNGQLLTPALSGTIVCEKLLDVLCFSIDAATGPTYRRIRKGGSWEMLIANLDALVAAKNAHESGAPILFFSFCAMRKNIEELPDFVRLAAHYGASKVIVQHVVESKLTPNESLVHHREVAEPIMERTRRLARELSIDLDMRNLDPVAEGDASAVDEGVLPTPAAFKEKNRLVKDCPFPWEHIFLKSNYEVQICAILWEEMVMGNLRQRSIGEIWNGDGYHKLRQQMCGTDAPEACVYCYFKGWRRPTPIDSVEPAITMQPAQAGQLGRGWHMIETGADGLPFRWAKQEATLFLRNTGATILEVEMYEAADGPFLRGQVLVNDKRVADVTTHDLWGGPVPHRSSTFVRSVPENHVPLREGVATRWHGGSRRPPQPLRVFLWSTPHGCATEAENRSCRRGTTATRSWLVSGGRPPGLACRLVPDPGTDHPTRRRSSDTAARRRTSARKRRKDDVGSCERPAGGTRAHSRRRTLFRGSPVSAPVQRPRPASSRSSSRTTIRAETGERAVRPLGAIIRRVRLGKPSLVRRLFGK